MIRQNPNFASNFSDGNMTDSLKLAEYNANDHDNNVRKQFLKYAGGGNREQEERERNELKFDMLPEIKNIKTEQSQISNADGGFKKKSNQAEILN